MEIAFILSSCENSGPFIVARDIVNNIVDQANVTIYYLKESAVKLDFKAPCKKIDLLSKTDFSKYDIVHSHGFIADAYSYLNRKTIKKRITTLHQEIKPQYSMNYNPTIGFFIEKIWLRFIKNANMIVTLTNEMACYYRGHLKRSEITFVYNGISPVKKNITDNDELEKIINLKKKHKIIGVSASLQYRKGIDQLIRALELDKQKNFALLLMGKGDQKEELQKLALELKVEERCLFLGYKDDAINYFSFFDLYAMCSRIEGFGLCIIEAASQKIPVVCSNLPVFNELFEDGEIEIYELNNIESLLNAIKVVDSNREKFSEKIYSRYIAQYTAPVMAANYLKIYNQLIKDGKENKFAIPTVN